MSTHFQSVIRTQLFLQISNMGTASCQLMTPSTSNGKNPKEYKPWCPMLWFDKGQKNQQKAHKLLCLPPHFIYSLNPGCYCQHAKLSCFSDSRFFPLPSDLSLPARNDPHPSPLSLSISHSLAQEMRASNGFLRLWWSRHCRYGR